jgi:hypothetical protein
MIFSGFAAAAVVAVVPGAADVPVLDTAVVAVLVVPVLLHPANAAATSTSPVTRPRPRRRRRSGVGRAAAGRVGGNSEVVFTAGHVRAPVTKV